MQVCIFAAAGINKHRSAMISSSGRVGATSVVLIRVIQALMARKDPCSWAEMHEAYLGGYSALENDHVTNVYQVTCKCEQMVSIIEECIFCINYFDLNNYQ